MTAARSSRPGASDAPPSDVALVLLGHGSRDATGAREFLAIAAAVQHAVPHLPVQAGVLEFAGPVAPAIGDAFARCVARGARRVLALPVLLHFGGHATTDMPLQVAAARERHPGIEIRLARPLSGHSTLLDVVADRCADTPLGTDRGATVLLVGRGSTSPGANADLYATARLFRERGHYAEAEVCFVSLAPPCISAGLRRCIALGARSIIVAPYFMNTGLLVRRIATQVAATQLVYPHVAMAVAAHIGPDSRLVAALLARAHDAWPDICAEMGNGESGTHARRQRSCRLDAPDPVGGAR